jgi:hypothetical protein
VLSDVAKFWLNFEPDLDTEEQRGALKQVASEYDALEAGFWAQWHNHPVFYRSQFAQGAYRTATSKISPVSPMGLRTPEDVVVDKIMTQGSILSERTSLGALNVDVGDEVSEKAMRVMIFKMMDRAVPYLWKNEIRLAATRQRRLPRHQIAKNLMPVPIAWWTWETDIVTPERNMSCVSMLLCDFGVGFLLLQFFRSDSEVVAPEDQRASINGAFIPHSVVFPDDIPTPIMANVIDCVLKMLAFIRSPFLCVEERKTSRPLRRELKRTQQDPLPEVRFVDLRRVQQQPEDRGDTEGSGRDWRWRWLVSGHFRAQWHPSTQTHEIMWIAPYMKGPEDKPIKPRMFRVMR